MIVEVISVLYFFVPAYIANLVPVFAKKIPFLNYPLDFGYTLNGKRAFGSHKTWRGMIFGIACATLAFYLMQRGGDNGFWLTDLAQIPLWVGAAMGFGALIGDALESTVKRQLDVAPGKSLFFWDQMDFMIGALVVTTPYWVVHWVAVLIALAVILVLNLAIQRIGFLLKLKDDPL